MNARRRTRVLLACFALTAPLLLGGCSETYCEEPAADSLEGLIKGVLCIGFGFTNDERQGDRVNAVFEARPSTIPSGGLVTLDASGSTGTFRNGREEPIVFYVWDIDGSYLVHNPGAREFNFEFRDPSASNTSRVRLFRRDPAFVGPPGEIIDNGESETRIIALKVTDKLFKESTVVGRVTITGDPVPPGGPPPVAIFRVTPPRPSVGQNVVLDAFESERAVIYAWDLDDNGSFETGPSSSPQVTHVFTTPGINVVRLQVTDARGRTAAAPREISVEEAASAAAAGRALRPSFNARLAKVRFPSDLGTGRRAGKRVSFGPLLASGRLIAAAPGRPELAPFRRSAWKARLGLSVRPASGRLRLRGVALARFSRSNGRACLRIRARARRGKAARGFLAVLGGSGPAAELRGGGRFRFRFEGRRPVLEGRLGLKRGAARSLPPACAGV